MRVYIICGLLIVIGVVLCCVYTVNDGEMAIVRAFGKYKRTTEAGLHVKKPWETTKMINAFIRTLDFKPKEVPITGDEGEMKLDFDGEILWGIVEPRAYELFNKTGNERDKNHKNDSSENFDVNEELLSPIEKTMADKATELFANIVAKMKYAEIAENKEEIAGKVKKGLNEFMSKIGVFVEDFTLKEVKIVADEELKKANHDAYIEERKAVAARIKANTDREVALINAETKKQAAFLEAEGEQRRREVRIKILEAAQNAGVSEQYLRDETLATYREMGKSGNSKIVMFPGGGSFSDMGRLASVVASAVSAAREATSEETAEKEEKEDTEE